MKKLFALISILSLVIGFYACTHNAQTTYTTIPQPNNIDTSSNNNQYIDTTQYATDTSVCFQRDILPIFTGYCAKSGCHDATSVKDGYNLTTYATIVMKGLIKGNALGSKLYTKCVSGKMPQAPTPKLDSTQLSLMRRWINMGAPNDTNCIVICDTTKFTFTAAIVPILTNYCYSCHTTAAAASSGGGIVLDTYNGVLTETQNGNLLGDIQHATGHHYMPLGGTQLSPCKITQVSKWIAAGAQNN